MLMFAGGVALGVALWPLTRRALRWVLPRAATWHFKRRLRARAVRVVLQGPPYTERRL